MRFCIAVIVASVSLGAWAGDDVPTGHFIVAKVKFAFQKPEPKPCDVVSELAIAENNEIRLEDRFLSECPGHEPPAKNTRQYRVVKSDDFFCGSAYVTADRRFFLNDYRKGPKRCFDPLPGDPPAIKTDLYLQEIGEDIKAGSAVTCANCPGERREHQ